MLAVSICRREVRFLSYVIIGFAVFGVIHVSLVKIENLRTTEARVSNRAESMSIRGPRERVDDSLGCDDNCVSKRARNTPLPIPKHEKVPRKKQMQKKRKIYKNDECKIKGRDQRIFENSVINIKKNWVSTNEIMVICILIIIQCFYIFMLHKLTCVGILLLI